MTAPAPSYPARLAIDYPETLDRLTTFFRLIWVIPILIIQSLLSGVPGFPTLLMIVFRQRYPRWWFDYARELTRFGARVGAYLALLTDRYPSTEDEQTVHLEVDYPDVAHDLNRWLPLVKWLLAIPHYLVLIVLWFVAFWRRRRRLVRDPRHRPLSAGAIRLRRRGGRWTLRVDAYAFLLLTDRYPPFSLQ